VPGPGAKRTGPAAGGSPEDPLIPPRRLASDYTQRRKREGSLEDREGPYGVRIEAMMTDSCHDGTLE
jgi:hypothetical protein